MGDGEQLGSQEAKSAATVQMLCNDEPIPVWLDCDTGTIHPNFAAE